MVHCSFCRPGNINALGSCSHILRFWGRMVCCKNMSTNLVPLTINSFFSEDSFPRCFIFNNYLDSVKHNLKCVYHFMVQMTTANFKLFIVCAQIGSNSNVFRNVYMCRCSWSQSLLNWSPWSRDLTKRVCCSFWDLHVRKWMWGLARNTWPLHQSAWSLLVIFLPLFVQDSRLMMVG